VQSLSEFPPKITGTNIKNNGEFILKSDFLDKQIVLPLQINNNNLSTIKTSDIVCTISKILKKILTLFIFFVISLIVTIIAISLETHFSDKKAAVIICIILRIISFVGLGYVIIFKSMH